MCIKDKLYASFSDVKSRRGRGGVYEYITWKDVANRMNEVFGVHWSSEVMYQDIVGNNVVVRVRVMITDPDNGKVQYQEGFGGAQNDQSAEAGNPFKAAYSKALKDACKKWGVALYIDEDEAPSQSQSPPALEGPKMTPQTQNITPPTQNMEAPPSGYSGFETGVPPAAETAKPEVQDTPVPPVPEAPAAATVEPSPVSEGLPTPPGVAMPSAPPAQQVPAAPPAGTVPEAVPTPPQAAPEVPQTVPSTPPPTQPPVQEVPPAAPATSTPPTPPPAPSNQELPMTSMGGSTAMISDVQRAALHSILEMQKISYGDLVAEAFQANGINKSPLPAVDQLTYDEAVHVVKYGNDKFRKR